MKKISRIIICAVLVLAILIPTISLITANAATPKTTPESVTSTKEYYNIKDGLYTKKCNRSDSL